MELILYLMIAIGVWCGSPVSGPNNSRTKQDVQGCRERMLACAGKSAAPKKEKQRTELLMACFLEEQFK